MINKHIKLSEQARRRLMAGDLILRGFDNDEIIDILGISLSSVKRWRRKVTEGGLHTLARKSQTGCPKKLDDAKRRELKRIILKGARAAGYLVDRWTLRIVADLIRKKRGVHYTNSNVRRILHSLDLSYQKPDVEAAEHSPEAVKYWRHYVWPNIKKSGQKRLRPDFMG